LDWKLEEKETEDEACDGVVMRWFEGSETWHQ